MNNNIENLINLLPQLERVIELLKQEKVARSSIAQEPAKVQSQETSDENESDFDYLKSLLEGDVWPDAVDYDLICDTTSEDDKLERAEGIIELMIEQHLENLSFLDFGCGEGHIVNKSLEQKPKMAVGYDIVIPKQSDYEWNNIENQEKTGMLLTTNFDEVKELAPFDVILVYDVIDHIENETAKEMVEKVMEVSGDKTRIYIRCHPWCGRHGGHLYNSINKAFVHMVFSDEELEQLGVDTSLSPTQKVIRPVMTYDNLFNNLDDVIVKYKNIDRSHVEEFFYKNKIVNKRLMNTLDLSKFNGFQMEQSFLDFVIVKK